MKITKKWLREIKACNDGINWFAKQNETSATKLLDIAIKTKDDEILRYVNWAICRKFDKKQKIYYAVYAAEQVIGIYEKQYPSDNRPRKAIEAAKEYIKKQTEENADAVYNAYNSTNNDNTAYAAAAYAYAAAAYATYAAAAAYAADAATYADYAATAAADAYAVYNACSSCYNKILMKIKILEFGRKLLNV